MKKDNMDHTITMQSANMDFIDFGATPVVRVNHKVLDSSEYYIQDSLITISDSVFEVLLADSTKTENGFTFLFKGEKQEIPTQQYRFIAASPVEALSSIFTGDIYLLTRLKDNTEIYRRPYDTWK